MAAWWIVLFEIFLIMTTLRARDNKPFRIVLIFALFLTLVRCSEEEVTPLSTAEKPEKISLSSNIGVTEKDSAAVIQCKQCTYVVPAGVKVIDGKALGLRPGDVIGLNSAVAYRTLEFHNIVGTPEAPIIIRNCGGPASIVADDKWHAIKTENSKHFRITGGNTPFVYGIRVEGGEMGMKLDGLSTNFEVDHVEVFKAGFAGIMAKTDPTCDNKTIRGQFTMYDVLLHDNYVHETGGEGFYVGNSFWDGMERSCGKRLPHEIKGLKLYNNRVENTGWEAIQVGCAIEGTEIYNNTVKNYGTKNKQHQNNGIQIGSGTGGSLYNNLIKKGPGNGMIIMGTGDNVIYNNIIVDAGSNGIFCDERYTPGRGFTFLNNTILNPKKDGIRIYAELVPMNTIANNIISNPGTIGSYKGKRTDDDAFIYLLSSDVKVNMSNNFFAKSMSDVRFVDAANDNYRLKENSPAVNRGRDIANYKIGKDFYQSTRLRGVAYDIGASEF